MNIKNEELMANKDLTAESNSTERDFLEGRGRFTQEYYLSFLDDIDLQNVENSAISDEDLDRLVQEIITNPVFDIDMYDEFVTSIRDNMDEADKDAYNPGDDSVLLLAVIRLKNNPDTDRNFRLGRIRAIFEKWEKYCAYLKKVLKK